MVTHSMEDIKYFTDSVLFFVADPDPKVNIVFIDYIVGFLLPIVALAMTSMVVEILKDPSIKDESVVIEDNNEVPEEVEEIKVQKIEEPKSFIYY